MGMKAKFHQAQVIVTICILDDKKSYGTQQFTTILLLDTDTEWADARERISATIANLQQQLDKNDGDSD